MKNTSYKEIADICFSKIKDIDLSLLNEDIAYEIMIGYLPIACVKFQYCKQDLDDRDDVFQEFNFKLTGNNLHILCNYIVIEYIDSNYLRTTSSLKARLTPNDFKSLNLPQHLSKIIELREMLKSENDQLSIDKSYKDSDLYEIAASRKVRKRH